MTKITIVLLAAALLVGMSSLFIVDERQVAIKFRLGEIVDSDYEPGLHIKAPWPIMNVRKFDKRILTLDTRPERFLTGEKKNVAVDFFMKWRIKDPARYYTSFMGDERQAGLRLLQIIKNGLQLEFDRRTIKQVVADDRSEMMDSLTLRGNTEVERFGIEIIDVRIKQIELPVDVRNSVFQRMRAERERIAKEHRAEGQEIAKGIQAVAERDRTVILAEATRDAEVLRGEGDALATEIYANAYGENQEFYEFYRSMTAYREALANQSDVLVLEPDSEFFKYFGSNRPRPQVRGFLRLMNVDWQDLLAALALLLVIEGMVPFLNPQSLRRLLQTVSQLDDRSLRITGFISMLCGVLLLYLVR